MRLVTLRREDGTTRAGRVEDGEIVELPFEDVGALLSHHPEWERVAAEERGPTHDLAQADLAQPILFPPKIVGVGLNYVSHIQEMGNETPKHPILFAKYARALTGPRDPIVLPRVSDKVDWEVELAIVIGQPARHVQPHEVTRVVAGYSIINDVSVRDWQMRTGQFLSGKTFERSTPLGPALVTHGKLLYPGELDVQCEVDGEVVQQGNTSDLLFGIVELVCYLSQIFTLDPGDVIATGTPSGVGAGRKPPVFLKPGQVVRTSIEGLGELVNPCVAEE